MSRAVVVGGGIAGSSAAYWLSRMGASVTLIDAGWPGQATAAGAGIISDFGSRPRSPSMQWLLSAAVDHYDELVAALHEDGQDDTGYRRVGELVVGFEAEAEALDRVRKDLQSNPVLGPRYRGRVSRLVAGEAVGLFPPLHPGLLALHVEGVAQVDGRRITQALWRAVRDRGGAIVNGVATVLSSRGRVSGVRVGATAIAADVLVLAGGAWTSQASEPLGVRIPVVPERGELVHLELPEPTAGVAPIVTRLQSRYLLSFGGGRIVAGATRDQASGFDCRPTAAGVLKVLADAVEIAPGLRNATMVEARAGLRPVTPDGTPVIGRAPAVEGIALATGFGAHGLTIGPFAGKLAAAAAIGERLPPDLEAFRLRPPPGRRDDADEAPNTDASNF